MPSRIAAVCVLSFVTFVGAGCGTNHKMSAIQTTNWLERHQVARGVHVDCGQGRDGWDYQCTLTGEGLKGSHAENTYGYDVDAHKVTGFSG